MATVVTSSPVAVRVSRIPVPVRPTPTRVTATTTATVSVNAAATTNGSTHQRTTSVTTDAADNSSTSPATTSATPSSAVAARARVSSGASRRSTLPGARSSGTLGSSSGSMTKERTSSIAATLQQRRTLPSSTSSTSSSTTTDTNHTSKRLANRSSSGGSALSTTSGSGASAAALIRAKKAAAAAAATGNTNGTTGGRTLGTVMGGGRHVDPAQRRARKAAAAAAAAAKASTNDATSHTDGDAAENGEGKGSKSKVVRGELHYAYGRCRYALTAGDSLGSIRAALNKHGWKELKDPNAITWDLFWSISSRALQPAKMKPSQICNHFQANGCITTKIGLCRNTRKVSGHVDTFFPRCFVISEPKEMELFVKQYQIQAAAAVLLRYLSLADATLHSKDPSVIANSVPALMTPTVVWLAMLAIRGHCKKLATALEADTNWTPLKPIHPRDPNIAAMLESYSFPSPPDDASTTSSSSTSSTSAPGATHKRRSELDNAEWKLVVKCAESFSGISKLPLVARSKADMELLPAADPSAPPPIDGEDDNGDDNDNEGDDSTANASISLPSDGGVAHTTKPVAPPLVETPTNAIATPSSPPTNTNTNTNGPISNANGKTEVKSATKAKRSSTTSKEKGGSGIVKSKESKSTSGSRTVAKSSKTGSAGPKRSTGTTKSRDPVWEENISSPLFSTRTIREALSTAVELRKVDPQFLFNGEHNVWILKPGGKSRGRGIQCFDTLLSITKYMKKDHKDKWVAQKYLERPLTVYKKKFDIRQWVFVTQFGSCLRLWFYNDCYVRFSSQDFDLTDLSPAIHLTNNSIQGKLADFDTLDFDAKGNMWSSTRFEDFLEANYSSNPLKKGDVKENKSVRSAKTIWMERLRPQMKQIARYAIECGYGRMKYRSHTFELFGLDYMLDENLTPWLLEVNSSPTLCHIAVEGIVERMTYDLFCVLFAEHQRFCDEEGGRDKVGAVVTSPILERKQSSTTPAAATATDATNDGASSSSSTPPRPPPSTSGVPIGGSMSGSKWELINELRLASRGSKA